MVVVEMGQKRASKPLSGFNWTTADLLQKSIVNNKRSL